MLESIRYSSQDILTYFSREINGLKDSRPETRVSSLKTLVSEITREPLLKPCKSYLDIIQELLEELSKTLLRLFNDEKEKCREFSIRLLTLYGIYSLVSGCVDIAGTLGYVFPIVVDRLEAYDLEGIQELPEQMRPIPSQKPQVILNPPEKSEEVRVLLSQLVLSILQKTEPHLLTGYLNELTNITRVLVMDPNSSETILIGCNAMTILCTKATDKLLHYSENLGRSLFTALVHKHWKVRKAGLESLKQVMYCGVYKYNHLIIEALIGFRDPNVVPIKEFYEVSTKLNYFAILVNDKSAHVRSVFFSVIADWLTKLPDKYDHESRLIPYILTGLFDPIPEIKEDCFRYIEEIGQIYEVEKEKDIREMRQLGYQEPWTCEGLMSDLPLPDPFVKRPRLGSRLYFRQYIRRYLNAIFHELGDWISTARLYSSNLLLSLIIFTEDYITQNLDKFLVCMYKALVINNSAEILKNLELSVMLVGRFVDANSYVPQVLTAIMVRYGIYSLRSLHIYV
jgi:hypothetical protein